MTITVMDNRKMKITYTIYPQQTALIIIEFVNETI
jgi:hypothetical protein